MARQKQIGWKMLVATALLSALFIAGNLFIYTPKASAAPPSPQTCFDKFNGIDIIRSNLSIPDQTLYDACRGSGTCVSAGAGTAIGSVRLRCTDPSQAATTSVADAEVAPLVLAACGPAPAGNAAQDAFLRCATAVRSAYAACRMTGGPVTSSVVDTPAHIAACYVNRVRNNRDVTSKISTAAATTAISKGQAAANALSTANAQAAAKADCEARGGTWDTSKTPAVCDTSAEKAIDPNLECHVTLNPLTWFLCPIVNGMNNLVGQLDNGITTMLTVDQAKIFNTSTPTGKGYYDAWKTFRGFALAILVVSGLAMVIAQGLGFEILDAYTIKKILPRLIFAVIGIALSWEIMKFFVIFTNDLGQGVRQIIYYPFRNIPGHLQLAGGSEWIANLIGAGAIAALGIIGLLSFALTAALAVAVAFLVLVVRQLVIIVLILFAPIAIACSILPNTQGVFKLWYESFTKAMMMFPIIVAFIAIGKVFAVTSIGSDIANAQAISQLIAFAAYVMPYFLIPLTFRFAGGAMRTLGGGINDRSRGGFDRLKKYRGNTMAMRGQKAKAGELYNNRVANTLTARGSTRNLGFGRRGREAYDQKMALASGAFGQSDKAKGIMFKDPVLQAMSYGSAMEAENRLKQDHPEMSNSDVKDAIAGVKASGGFGKNRQIWAAKQLAATGTGYDNDTQMFSTIARVSGGNKALADSMWGEMRGTSERAGRNDLKASYGMGSKLLSDMIDNGDARASVPAMETKYQDRFDALGVDAARGVDGMSLARNKPVAIRNLMKRMDQSRSRHEGLIESDNAKPGTITHEQRNFSEATIGQISAKMQNMETNVSYGPEVNAEAVHGTRIAVPKASEQLTDRRMPGIQNSHPAAAAAQDRNTGANQSYQEESLGRQPYIPGQDNKSGNDDE